MARFAIFLSLIIKSKIVSVYVSSTSWRNFWERNSNIFSEITCYKLTNIQIFLFIFISLENNERIKIFEKGNLYGFEKSLWQNLRSVINASNAKQFPELPDQELVFNELTKALNFFLKFEWGDVSNKYHKWRRWIYLTRFINYLWSEIKFYIVAVVCFTSGTYNTIIRHI